MKKIIALHYPQYKDVGYFYKQYIQQHLHIGMKILHAGCGTRLFAPELFNSHDYFSIGVDVSRKIVENNIDLDNIVISSVDQLPFADNVFDIIICEWLFEHLEFPDKVIKEYARVLKNGGKVLFMTPQKYSPIMLISRILPTFLHKFFRKILLGIPESDTFPTYYHLNTFQQINYYFGNAGFKKLAFQVVGALAYFRFSSLALRVAIIMDKLSTFLNFVFLKDHIAGAYQIDKIPEKKNLFGMDIFQCPHCLTKLSYEFKMLHCKHCDKEFSAKLNIKN